MRAITVRQPWAWAIIHGGKDVENRTRNIAGAYRGLVAIHAAIGYEPDAWGDHTLRGAWLGAGSDLADSVRGAVIGVVDLIDVHNHEAPRVNSPRRVIPALCPSPWALSGHHHLVLRDARPLATPIPWRGALGLWTVPDELEAAIREQVTL